MRGKYHMFLTAIFFIPIILLLDGIRIHHYLFPVALTLFPDSDNNFVPHRNWLTHSIIPWSIIYFIEPTHIVLVAIVSIGFHCVCDIQLAKKKRTGWYTISFYPFKRINGNWSTVWLMMNFIIAMTILIVVMLF